MTHFIFGLYLVIHTLEYIVLWKQITIYKELALIITFYNIKLSHLHFL